MKNWKKDLANRLLILVLLAIGLFYAGVAIAQDVPPGLPVPPDAMNFILSFAVKYPWIGTVLLVMGILRVLFKPIMTAIENSVANNPARLAAIQAFEGGMIFKVISWVLDFGASIKVPHTVIAATVPKSN